MLSESQLTELRKTHVVPAWIAQRCSTIEEATELLSMREEAFPGSTTQASERGHDPADDYDSTGDGWYGENEKGRSILELLIGYDQLAELLPAYAESSALSVEEGELDPMEEQTDIVQSLLDNLNDMTREDAEATYQEIICVLLERIETLTKPATPAQGLLSLVEQTDAPPICNDCQCPNDENGCACVQPYTPYVPGA